MYQQAIYNIKFAINKLIESRSPTIIISYIMKRYNMTYNQAFEYINKRRKIELTSTFIELNLMLLIIFY